MTARAPRGWYTALATIGVLGLAVVVVLAPSGGGNGKPASTVARGTVYVESNAAGPGRNSVLAFRYGPRGLRPLRVAEYPTRGSGSADLTNSGALDADQQIVVNARRTLLFAVNQGSDTVAVFRIGEDGSLSPAPGSPFDSGGRAPGSAGIAGDTLIVANKAHDGVRRLTTVPASYAAFAVAGDGRLRPTGSPVRVPPRSSPTQVFVAPHGRVVVTTEETGLFRSFVLGPRGTLTAAARSPQDLPLSVFPGGVRTHPVWPAGLSAHPRLWLIYSGVPNLSKLVVYSYDGRGRLRFIRSLPDAHSFLPCWTAVSRDGRRLYTSNAGSGNVSVFDIAADPRSPHEIQAIDLRGKGNPWNIGIDPTGRLLFVLTPRSVEEVPPGEGNSLHVLRIRRDGRLAEPAGSPVPLPVPLGTNPLGLAIVGHN